VVCLLRGEEAIVSDKAMAERYLPKCPHPETGEAFLPAFEISVDSNNTLVEFYERSPEPPVREYYDSEGYEVVRSDEEMRTLRARYEATLADWVKQGSPIGPRLSVLAGVPTTTGRFVTKSGAKAEGVLLPDGTWRWTKLEWKSK
jgi:hypothetical protein